MNAASLPELLNVPATVLILPAQIAVRPLQTFAEELLVACQVHSSKSGTAQPQKIVSPVIELPAVKPQPTSPQPVQIVPPAPSPAASLKAVTARPSSHARQVTSAPLPATHLPSLTPDLPIALASLPQPKAELQTPILPSAIVAIPAGAPSTAAEVQPRQEESRPVPTASAPVQAAPNTQPAAELPVAEASDVQRAIPHLVAEVAPGLVVQSVSKTTPALPSPASDISAPNAPITSPVAAVTAPASTPAPLPAAVDNPKNVTVKAVEDIAAPKPHAPAVSDQNGSQSRTGDQSSGTGPQQGQTPTRAPAAVINHPTIAADNPPSAAVAATPPPPNVAPTTVPAGHTAKAAEPPSPPADALPQPVPVINTAKLIQTVGQSEVRVGVRSNDFGNISISTSATRDVISAQISLEHGELARTLAAHVPEMQARLGGNQAMEVRIDMNGQATGQGNTTSPGTSTGQGDGSRGEQPPRGNAAPAHQSERAHVTATAAVLLAESAPDTRLDVRV